MIILSTDLCIPCLGKPQQSVPPLKIKQLNSIRSFPFKLVHGGNAQGAKPKTTQRCTISGVSPCEDALLFTDWPDLIKISIGSADLLLGQAIHAYLVKSGTRNDQFEGNNLLNLYAKFDRLDMAQRVFEEMLVKNTITWTSMVKVYSEHEDFQSAFSVACDMHKSGEKFNEHTCSVILRVCSSLEDRILGQQIHCFVIKSGYEDNVFVGTSLISMYSRSGYFSDAENVFNGVTGKDVQCLNVMILEYGRTGFGRKAIGVFIDLLSDGLEPNDYTFTNIINLCSGALGVEEGVQLHGLAVKYGFLGETSVANAVITMYGKNGMVKETETMFSALNKRNLISCNALMSGYMKSGCGKKAIDVFLALRNLSVNCDCSLLATVLDGCSECSNLGLGLQLHGFVIKLGYLRDVNVGTALVDLYAKCGNRQSARVVFNGLPSKSTASFNAILAGFTEKNEDDIGDPMVFFSQLRLEGLKPDLVTFSRLLSLSANQASLVRGRSLHAYILKTGFEAHFSVANAIITMYAKCGSVEDAHRKFNAMDSHDIVSWNAIISAYALHGLGQKALFLFQEMEKKGYFPDEISILTILQACTYTGLWEDGIYLFNLMGAKYRIQPSLEHYSCMINLLGRAGYLSEAMDIIVKCPLPDSTLLWRTLVHVCKLRADLNFGKLASKHLLDLSPEEAGSYILISNMYAGEGMLGEATKVRTVMNDLKLSKEVGCSWIEIDNKVHHFVANGKEHPESREIYARLDLLTDEMRWK